jgi:SAM-dependent methyltransferase
MNKQINFSSTYHLDIGGARSVRFVYKTIRAISRAKGSKLCILDIGCGTGQLTNAIAYAFDCEITAIDIDFNSINAAEIGAQQLSNVHYLLTSYEDFNSDKKYDVVLMTQVLDHVKDPKEILKKVVTRNLNEIYGTIIVGISNGYGIYERIKHKYRNKKTLLKHNARNRQLIEHPFTNNNNSPHLWQFSRKSLNDLMIESALKIVKLEKITFILPAYPLCMLYYNSPFIISKLLEFIDGLLAKILPASFSSNWYFSCTIAHEFD